MSGYVLTISLLSALLLGFYDFSKKLSLQNNPAVKVVWVANLSGLLFILPFAWANHILSLENTLRLNWQIAIFFKAILVNLSWNLAYIGLKHLPISIASPLRATAPFWVILGAICLFAERPSGLQWLGLSIVLFSYLSFSLIGKKEGIKFISNPWIFAMLGATLLGAASALYDKYLLTSLNIPYLYLQTWFSIYLFLSQSLLIIWSLPKLQKIKFHISMPFIGIILVCSDLLYFRAIQETGSLISLISPLRRSGVLLSFILGGLFFKEQNLKNKFWALIALLIGAFLLGLG